MHVVLIPYFLAANILVEDTQPWPFGAEYTYRGVLDAVSEKRTEDSQKMHLEYDLKCRNQNESSIICRMSEVHVRSTDNDLEEDIDNISQLLSTPFLINFDENGVDSVSISNKDLVPLISLYQYIASMFHIGTDLTGRQNPSSFELREASVLGDCNASFNITTRQVPDTISNEVLRKRNFRLQVIPYPEMRPGTAIEIDKVRHTKTCNAVNRNMKNTPISSKGKMFIDSAGIFKSDVKDVDRVEEREGKQLVSNTYRLHMSLELMNVERATECFLTMSYAKTAGLEVEDDDSDSDSDSDSYSDSDSDSGSISDDLFML